MTYKETLEIARKLYKETWISQATKDALTKDIPELKESEDEKIRKCIEDLIKENAFSNIYGVTKDDCLAWLEKQGEQKPFDYEDATIQQKDFASIDKQVKPKFKVGDWITNGDYTWKIVDVKLSDYILQSQDGNIVDDTISHVDSQFHLWTIQDAKDGDVLVTKEDGRPFLFKGLDNRFPQLPVAYCGINVKNDFKISSINSWWTDETVYPATEEQRDLLFSKMKEAGYEWDEEKKESKLLITNGGDFESENCEQEPAWSEEDERLWHSCIAHIEDELERIKNDKYGHSEIISDLEESCRERIKWLKSLKERKGE